MTEGRTHQPWRRLLVAAAAALLCGASLSAQQQPVYVSDPASGNQVAGHTLNLRDADISSLIATVSEITGRNFIIDPRVTADPLFEALRMLLPTDDTEPDATPDALRSR